MKDFYNNIEQLRETIPKVAKSTGKKYIRRIAEISQNIVLEKGTYVHHIDMDDTNNSPDNLIVCYGNSQHSSLHGSLNKLVKELIKREIIYINVEEMKYKIKKKSS